MTGAAAGTNQERLTLAGGDYAHTRLVAAEPLPGPDGGEVGLLRVTDRPAAIFRRALEDSAPYDIAEMSLASAYVLADRRDPRFVALPVFPSRLFRHGAFYAGPGLTGPDQLRGRRIGVIRYGMTAAVWARALLAAEYGLAPNQMEWWIGEEQFFQPVGMDLHPADGQAGLEAMLEDGRLDCLFSVHLPAAFSAGRVGRLFGDVPAAERASFARTGYVPIMHTVLVKRTAVEARPWLPGALMARFEACRDDALAWLLDTDASTLPLPFQHAWSEDVFSQCGGDPWPYGLAANGQVLQDFGAAMAAQGLTSRVLAPEEVFAVP